MNLAVQGVEQPLAATPSCVCYVVDEGYLFNTLVSAVQARQFATAAQSEVIIVCVGPTTDAVKVCAEIAAAHGIELISAPADALDGMMLTFGRLFLNRLLPGRFKRVLYIDGDTQVAGSLDPVLEAHIPPGHFMACRDPMYLFADLSPARRAALIESRHRMGFLGKIDDYVNAGVLVVDLEPWKALSQAALETYLADPGRFRHYDQDAINVAVGDRCLRISNRWNFAGFLIGSAAEAARRPHIYHFMSNPRPWKVTVNPWGPRYSKPYQDILRTYPALAALAPKRSLRDQLRYTLQQEVKTRTEYRRVGRVSVEPTVCELA